MSAKSLSDSSSSILLLSYAPTLLARDQILSKKVRDYRATGWRARNAQFGDEVGGRRAVGRSSEGKNNKDGDHGRKLCRRHIKLSTHSLGRVSAGLEMKTFNPTVA